MKKTTQKASQRDKEMDKSEKVYHMLINYVKRRQ